MTVVGTESVSAGTTQEYFQSLAALGFACVAEDVTRWRVRRIHVACSHGSATLVYEGGFPVGYGSVIFDRVHRDGTLLGGTALTAHVQAVAFGVGTGPDGKTRTIADVRAAVGGADR